MMLRHLVAATGLSLLSLCPVLRQEKSAELRIGITTYNSGPSSVVGIPARDAAEMLGSKSNVKGGLQGVPVELYFDEGAGAKALTIRYGDLIENSGRGVMFALISSGVCNEALPAEDLKVLNLMWDCGTQCILMDDKYSYVFGTQANAALEVMAPSLNLFKTKLVSETIAVVSQDNVWGQGNRSIFSQDIVGRAAQRGQFKSCPS
ncbi:ABC transporter substrate-binding protein [Beijerinckia indica]|uniref:Extracellular ligand-binding receptor n=1 Tax=Beijerinckia indica subsp. indica (strain ATCC 9039 / DSM 1715 / NCIMB 8712) TaxID=395963 RepID=B2IJ96_BEII9|nr:ABC transporter substrate-binding protein [Beijerinckia indica]ACB96214.1 extracellular ligand-binding receptor [Beijerinckia indica subsp. indica ATCC 9039]